MKYLLSLLLASVALAAEMPLAVKGDSFREAQWNAEQDFLAAHEPVTTVTTNVTDRSTLTGDEALKYQLEQSFKGALLNLSVTNLARGSLPTVIAKGQSSVDNAPNDRAAASQASKNASLVALWVMLDKLGVDIYDPKLGQRYQTNIVTQTEWRKKQ